MTLKEGRRGGEGEGERQNSFPVSKKKRIKTTWGWCVRSRIEELRDFGGNVGEEGERSGNGG